MKFILPAIVFVAIAFITWKLSNIVLQRFLKVEKPMAEAISWALTMIVPLLTLYIWGSFLLK